MPASRAVRSGHRRNGVQLLRAWLYRNKNLIFRVGMLLFFMQCPSSLQGATVTVTIEFSDRSSQTYTLSKNGEFGSGAEVMGSLIHSLGGGFQVFDDYDWNRSDLTATSWIQWWKYGFGLALYGLSLNGHHDSGFTSGYWAIYTSTASNGPWVYADVGLADLVPENGSQIGLKYSSFDDTAGPSDSINTIDLILTAPPAGQPPHLVSIATIASDRLELTFATTPGCTYQLEENEFLAPAGWNAWGGIWVATATETVFTIQVQENKPKCFYRLHLLP